MKAEIIAVAVAMFALIVTSAGAQSVACTPAQIANYSGAKLVGITGSIGWITQYYSFAGFNSAQIIYPNVVNYTAGSKPGSSYLIYANYMFDGPNNLTATPAIVFVLVNNTEQGCASMKLFAYNDVVMHYNPSSLLTAQQATNDAQKAGYNVTFGGPISLVPQSNTTGIQLLVPGYTFTGKNYTAYSNAENGSVSSTGIAHIGSGQQNTTGTLSNVGSSISGIYNFLKSIWDWIAKLFGSGKVA